MNKIFNEDVLTGINKIEDNSIDLILTDPPYCLGKDYGNDSDQKSSGEYLEWTYKWIDAVLPKLKDSGSFYIFLSWQYSPEIFVYLKKELRMINEIIWDSMNAVHPFAQAVWAVQRENFLPFTTISVFS